MQLEAPDSLDNDRVTPLVIKLLARIAELEARLNIPPKTPDNSSWPPSKGQKPNTPPSVKKPRKGRAGVARACAPIRMWCATSTLATNRQLPSSSQMGHGSLHQVCLATCCVMLSSQSMPTIRCSRRALRVC
jgi:hypothetical protein